MIYGYDFDGVISIGINPHSSKDIIITGRCIDEKQYVLKELKKRKIKNQVYFNPMTLEERGNHTISARIKSGKHKSNVINKLIEKGIELTRFFEDDEIQVSVIKNNCNIEIVHVISNLVEK